MHSRSGMMPLALSLICPSRLGMGGEMGDILETDDLVGDQDLVVSKSKTPSRAEPEKHSASHLLKNMEGRQ